MIQTAVVQRLALVSRSYKVELSGLERALTPFSAGCHIDLHIPGGIVRSYSIANSPADVDRYVLGIQLEPAGRGGSAWLHKNLREGMQLEVSEPRNNFALVEDASHCTLIGGGIGITPLLSMLYRLEELGRPWTLHYAARTRQDASFLDEVTRFDTVIPGRVHLYFDREPRGQALSMERAVAAAPPDSHLYCCGPAGMIQAFESAAASRPASHVHREHFAGASATVEKAFTVVLHRSNQELKVREGTTILDTLLDHGIEVPCSCLEGTCGSCLVPVLDGIPDHRDSVLSPGDRASGDKMLVCCSGSKSDRLVLDL